MIVDPIGALPPGAAPRSAESRRYFAQPYGVRDGFAWLGNNLFGPSRRHADLVAAAPADVVLDGGIDPQLTIGFVGDIMPFRRRRFRWGAGLKSFLQDLHLLVGNLEGVLARPGAPNVFMGQRHAPDVLDFLTELAPPERVLLGVANNHSADYGWPELARSCGLLRRRGFHIFGLAEQPAVSVGRRVVIAAGTAWSNRPAHYVARLDQIVVPARQTFRILYPHWGYEMQAYPHPRQVAACDGELAGWDMIVGHHSHWPQPVTVHETEGRRRLVAYSLGNFTFGLRLAKYLHGAVVVVEVGTRADGRWAAARLRWRPLGIRLIGGGSAEVELVDQPPG